VRGSTPGWSFFKVPRISLASQSARVYGGKIRHGRWYILRSLWPLIGRFILRRHVPARPASAPKAGHGVE
jgi:hypothetical protein